MAASLSSSLHSTLLPLYSSNPKPKQQPSTLIQCGPRSKRGPLVKGRVLSIEAIQAIQALKRHPDSDSNSTLARLLKPDLVAAMDELLRQDRCDLALKVFNLIRSEFSIGLEKYAGMVNGLKRMGMVEEIEELVKGLEQESGGVVKWEDEKSLVKMVKALTEAGRVDGLVKVYEMMKRSGWGLVERPDEYTVRVLSRGLRRLGEVELADEVQIKFGAN